MQLLPLVARTHTQSLPLCLLLRLLLLALIGALFPLATDAFAATASLFAPCSRGFSEGVQLVLEAHEGARALLRQLQGAPSAPGASLAVLDQQDMSCVLCRVGHAGVEVIVAGLCGARGGTQPNFLAM